MNKSLPFLVSDSKEIPLFLTGKEDVFLLSNEFLATSYKPFLTDFTVVFLLGKGKVTYELNCRRYVATAPCMVIIPPHILRNVIEKSEDTEKKLLALSQNVIDGIFLSRKERFFLNQAIFSKSILPLSKKQYRNILSYFDLIESELQATDNSNRIKIIQKLLETLIAKYQTSETIQNIMSRPRDRKEALLQKFHLALHDFCPRQRAVSFYADKLSVTPQYLSKVTKEKSGKSAMELIENYVIEHIKNTLLREDRNLKDLADDFSFGSFDLMNKYFKRRTGVSLSEYRKNGRLCLEKAGVELPYNK